MAINQHMYTCSSKKYKVSFVSRSFFLLKKDMEKHLPTDVVRSILDGTNKEWQVQSGQQRVH